MRTKVIQSVIKNVTESIERYRMFDKVEKVLIAFSAGPDSVCLLDIMHKLMSKNVEFELVYINHGLRSARALAREEKMTMDYAARYGVEAKILRIIVRKRKLGIEAAARASRYRVLQRYCVKTGAQRILLGHNLDDVVETFLLNILRGSGARGLRSIPATRWPFVRPLINVKKADVMSYLQARKLTYAIDRTNLSLAQRRNLLRIKVLPILRKLNPDIHSAIKREIEILKQDDEYIWAQVRKVYPKVAYAEKESILLDLHKIVRYNLSLVNRIVMKAILDTVGSLDGFESKHYHAILSLIGKQSGKRVVLPKGLYALRDRDRILIGHRKPKPRTAGPMRIGVGESVIGNHRLRVRVLDEWNLRQNPKNCEVFDLDMLDGPLYVRGRKDGDIIDTKIGRKKLKKVFSEQRIRARMRDSALILCDQKGILWILGMARAFRGFVSEKTKRFLVVEFEHID
jgi:tRNA(Ile)-lysidine synthase